MKKLKNIVQKNLSRANEIEYGNSNNDYKALINKTKNLTNLLSAFDKLNISNNTDVVNIFEDIYKKISNKADKNEYKTKNNLDKVTRELKENIYNKRDKKNESNVLVKNYSNSMSLSPCNFKEIKENRTNLNNYNDENYNNEKNKENDLNSNYTDNEKGEHKYANKAKNLNNYNINTDYFDIKKTINNSNADDGKGKLNIQNNLKRDIYIDSENNDEISKEKSFKNNINNNKTNNSIRNKTLNNSTVYTEDACINNLFEKNEKELDKTYKDLERIENILRNICSKKSNTQKKNIIQENYKVKNNNNNLNTNSPKKNINQENNEENNNNYTLNIKLNIENENIFDLNKAKSIYLNNELLSNMKSKQLKEKQKGMKIKKNTEFNREEEAIRSNFIKKINYDNDEMIKRLKRNIIENERSLLQRNSNIEKINNEYMKKSKRSNIRNKAIYNKRIIDFNNKNNNNKSVTKKDGLFWVPLDQPDESDNSQKISSNKNKSEKSNSFWIPLDQSSELTYSQKQKASKLTKLLNERANDIKRKHKDNSIQSIIIKENDLNSWKPKYLPI